jgi:hypothetical protein
MFERIKSVLGFPTHLSSSDRDRVPDQFPDLPRLPSIPPEQMIEPLQDTLGRALLLVALSSHVKPLVIERRLSSLWGKTIAETQTEITLIFQGCTPVTSKLVKEFALILRQPEEAVYRCALFLKQQEECSEPELLDDLLREAKRQLNRRGTGA